MRMKSPPLWHSSRMRDDKGSASRPVRRKPLLRSQVVKKFFAVAAVFHRSKARDQGLIDRKRAAVHGESASGQQHVIEEVGSRTMTAHHEDRAVLAMAWILDQH